MSGRIRNLQSLGEKPQEGMSFPVFLLACLAILGYAFGLLSIGLTKDWRLLHEDNGAMHTTMALSHLKLGLSETRAHNLFYNPKTKESVFYGHHPSGPPLILAGVFKLTGSASPCAARMVAIAFHLGSLILFMALLSGLFSKGTVLLGGYFLATLPMSSYFGRMFNYEPLSLFPIVIQLFGLMSYRLKGSKTGLIWLGFGTVIGGLIDWAAFFFAAAIAGVEVIDVFKKRSRSLAPLIVTAISAVGVFLFDLWHLWYAGGGSLTPLRNILFHSSPLDERKWTLLKFILSQLETFRKYFTHTALICIILALICLVLSRRAFSKDFFNMPNGDHIKRLLVVTGVAALGYVLAAPSWAMMHHYWQFYFLPVVTLSLLCGWLFLRRKIVRKQSSIPRLLIVLFVLEILATSAYMLHFRHTTKGEYAIKKTAEIRSIFLSPGSFMAPGRRQ